MIDVNKYIGKRYAEDGGDMVNSFNCATLYRAITGIDASIIPTCESGNKFEIIKAIKESTKYYDVLKEPKEGCIVALKRLRHYHHVGIWTNGGVLHAVEGIGVIFSTLKSLELNQFTWEFGEIKQNG